MLPSHATIEQSPKGSAVLSTQKNVTTRPRPQAKRPPATPSKVEKSEPKLDMSPFITSEGNIYCVMNIPEEYLAVLFAKVSRSPKPFREELERALTEEADLLLANVPTMNGLSEKARAFHEKWTVGYGHSSVAELATVNLCLEKVSRLATEQFELGSNFLSLTEFSQRYQRPTIGSWHNPGVGDDHAKFEEYFTRLFGVYEELVEKLTAYHMEKGLTKNVAEKLAFEDARYVLPLATYSQLGAKVNGRALADVLRHMKASTHQEIRDVAGRIHEESTKVLPTLIRHVEPSDYLKQYYQDETVKPLEHSPLTAPTAYFLSMPSERTMAHEFTEARILHNHAVPQKIATTTMKNMHNVERTNDMLAFFEKMGPHDMMGVYGESMRFKATFAVSEACWHQLLRHNRGMKFIKSPPSTKLGYVTPPAVIEAGLSNLYDQAALLAKVFSETLEVEAPEHMAYAVLNMHTRVVTSVFDMSQLFHLINLRTSQEAQWEIRHVMEQLHKDFAREHEGLAAFAKRRD